MAVELSIIVPCRGHAAELEVCLASLISQNTSVRYEVLVVYCRQELDVDAVVRKFPSVSPVASEIFLLAGEARNEGARRAQADYLAFIDADCWVDPNWVTFAFEAMQAGVLLCGGAILDLHPWDWVASTDNRLQFADFPPGRPYGMAAYMPGGNVAVRKDAFFTLGSFSNHPVAQDVVFTMTAAQRWPEKTIFNPQMQVRHFGRSAWKDFLSHQRAFGFTRAAQQIQISRTMAWISRYRWLGWLIFLRRLAYITLRVLQWNLRDLPRYLLQIPFILAGLWFWVTGFYDGMQERKQEIER